MPDRIDRDASARRREARRRRRHGALAADPALEPRAGAETRLALIACHFNWAGYSRPRQNLRRFLREMDFAGIPVYGVELHLPDQEPLLAGHPRWRVIEADPAKHLLWQKEALLNIAATLVPPSVPSIAAVDPDIRFSRPDWASLSSAAMADARAIQPYSEAVWTDREGAVDLRREAVACRDGRLDFSGHPGFAWVLRRDFWTRGPGFYPWCLSGSGDVVLAAGLMGLDMTSRQPGGAAGVGERNFANGVAPDWLASAREWMGGSEVGCIEGQVWHEWHGDRADRRYFDRHSLMAGVDVARHVSIDADGLVAWTSHAPAAVRGLAREHFGLRKEDG